MYEAEYNAGNVDYIADPATVFENRAQIKNLIAAGMPKPTSGGPWDDHHLTPQGKPFGFKDATIAQKALATVGIDLDSADNGMWLSRAFHQRLNNNIGYYDWVNGLLKDASTKALAENALNEIRQILTAADKVFQSGGTPALPFAF